MKEFLLLGLLFAAACKGSAPQPLAEQPLRTDTHFTLYVSNQSFAITPVDIRVEIDSDTVVDEDFDVGIQHTWKAFRRKLPLGMHSLSATTRKGDARLDWEFEVKGTHWAVLEFWYYPSQSHSRRHFSFDIRDHPIYFK